MRRAGDVALQAVQWTLVGYGFYFIVETMRIYLFQADLPDAAELLELAQSNQRVLFYVPMSDQDMRVNVARGLAVIGLGAVLFYLRRLFVSRPQ